MSDHNQFLDSIQEQDKDFAAQVFDLAAAVEKSNTYEKSSFLDPYRQRLVEDVARQVTSITTFVDGGYDGAERKRVVLMPEYYSLDSIETGLGFLLLEGNMKFQNLSHRDFLGSILGLGLKREKIGDIILVENGAQVIVDEEVVSFLLSNLEQVHQIKINISEISRQDIIPPEKKVKNIKSTVASMRLDAIASTGFGVSRTKMATVIKAGRVKVNWQPAESSSYKVNEGDIISISGKGRIEVAEIEGKSRKGRIRILLKKIL